MTSNKVTQRSTLPTFGGFPNNNASLRLEKTKPGVRRSTPDSEALASSDDEAELLHYQSHQSQNTSVPRPTRRTSWLNEVHPAPQRKSSLTTSGSFSPANSYPTTPAADQTAWGSNTSPSLAATMNWNQGPNTSFPWGAGIWNSETRKEPPSRLTEVLPSPTSMNSPGNAINFPDELYSPTATRGNMGDSSIPFAIPLHPTPKTYRSQSYSVGQLDPELVSANPPKPSGTYTATRGRGASQYNGLQHRPSRPSMLGDLGHDPATLGRVREDDVDEESVDEEEEEEEEEEDGGMKMSVDQQMEQLKLENAMLRQAATTQLENARVRERTVSTASGTSRYPVPGESKSRPKSKALKTPVIEEVADSDEEVIVFQPALSRIAGRRLSEQAGNIAAPENRNLENVKKAHWQTSLGFGGIGEPPQSRRHSFADMPTRHGSISSVSEIPPIMSGPSTSTNGPKKDDGYGNYPPNAIPSVQTQGSEYAYFFAIRCVVEEDLEHQHLRNRIFAASYFTGHEPISEDGGVPIPVETSLHQAYVMPSAYGRPQHGGMNQAQQIQTLFIVTFKCCRSDVFYIQEDTGLQVNPGELVIVEADRGTDLGTVAHANISWSKAKELKEHYAEEHYKWLMLFSRQSQTGGPNAFNPNGVPFNPNGTGSTIGGMGPQNAHHGSQDVQSGEIKPKLIKRLAQNHEIQALRDKEGNEAKAKRVCQQKVAEHRLNMEILDAEFQMDWKKLTFYYFADTYINFNSLVTDLFKIYKTRIWMSAINPASFVTPTAGLQPPNSAGPGAMGRESPSERRRQYEPRGYGVPPMQTSPGYGSQLDGRDTEAAALARIRDRHDTHLPYRPNRDETLGIPSYPPIFQQQQPNTFIPYGPSQTNYGNLGIGLTGIGPASMQNSQDVPNIQDMRRTHPNQNDWATQFQSLSLGS